MAATEPTTGGLWSRLADRQATTPFSERSLNLWQNLEDRLDWTKLRPRRIADFELNQVGTSPEGKQYILKNPRSGSYLWLSEREIFLWNLMDGASTSRDIAVEYFLTYLSLDPDLLTNLLGRLKANGFLEERYSPVFEALARRLPMHGWGIRLLAVVGALFQQGLTFRDADAHFSAAYGRIGRALCSRPSLALGLLLVLCDLILFPYYLLSRELRLTSPDVLYGGGLAVLIVAVLFGILAHEYAHGLTCRHFGRKVRGAGFLLYFGIPGFYVDTTDIWMAPRPQRVTVSLAGVYANAVLAGIGMLVVALAPPSVASDLALLFVAILNVLICANLVPVLEKDGYYALSDCLEMPRLRRRAYEFLRRNLWARLKQRERLGRTEVIFLLYALLEAAMIALYVMITVGIVTTAGPSLLRTLRDNPSSTIETVLPALAILLFFPIARLAAPRLRRALNHRRGTEATAGRG